MMELELQGITTLRPQVGMKIRLIFLGSIIKLKGRGKEIR
jgi:hypothetical protein